MDVTEDNTNVTQLVQQDSSRMTDVSTDQQIMTGIVNLLRSHSDTATGNPADHCEQTTNDDNVNATAEGAKRQVIASRKKKRVKLRPAPYEPIYSCLQCDQIFTRKTRLTSHVTSHHAIVKREPLSPKQSPRTRYYAPDLNTISPPGFTLPSRSQS
eukprot:44222_1